MGGFNSAGVRSGGVTDLESEAHHARWRRLVVDVICETTSLSGRSLPIVEERPERPGGLGWFERHSQNSFYIGFGQHLASALALPVTKERCGQPEDCTSDSHWIRPKRVYRPAVNNRPA